MFSPSRLPLLLESVPPKAAKGKACELKIDYGFVQKPLGRCLIGEVGASICYLAFAPTGSDSKMLADLAARWPGASLNHDPHRADKTSTVVFDQRGSADTGIKLLVRGTCFQVEVWRALLGIPPGNVCTYAEVARRVGRPKATRAVGSAIGANPIAWLIPCHRVIRSDGQLGGYRWGVAMKKACLGFEKQSMRPGE
jgi:AraC family transcriptional regulator of adaptative response/methylated-DNA-[protein]-cysteine methyltransferase